MTLAALSRLLPGLTPLRHGVAVTAGSPYFSAETSAPHLRLSYVSPAGAGHLGEGIRRLHHAYTRITPATSSQAG